MLAARLADSRATQERRLWGIRLVPLEWQFRGRKSPPAAVTPMTTLLQHALEIVFAGANAVGQQFHEVGSGFVAVHLDEGGEGRE